MLWELSFRADPRGAALADRHYTRQKVGSPQFMPPGACVVLYAGRPGDGEALWGTSMPYAQYVKHEWAGAWVCSIFHNAGADHAHKLVIQALAATRAVAGDPPALGMVTFVDRRKVKPYVTPKGRSIYGQCFRQAGFKEVGETKGGLLALQLLPADFPPADPPHLHASTYYARAA